MFIQPTYTKTSYKICWSFRMTEIDCRCLLIATAQLITKTHDQLLYAKCEMSPKPLFFCTAIIQILPTASHK